jgi:DNA-binding transcriptional regulator YhcF (GntR family)
VLANVSIPVAELANLKPQHVSVLAGLLAFADRAGRCWPSLRKLAEITGLKLSRVHRAIAEMESAGILTRARRGAGTLYQLAERFVWQAIRRSRSEPDCSTSENVSSASGTEGEAKKEIQDLKTKRDIPVRRAAPPLRPAEGPNPFARRQWLRKLNSFIGERLRGPQQWAGWEVVAKALDGDSLAPDEKRALDGIDRMMRGCGS